MSASKSSTPFIQLVSFKATDAATRDLVWQAWQPGFEYVRNSEVPSGITLTYQGFFPVAGQKDADTELVAWETYRSKEDLDNGHEKSEVVKTFLASFKGRLAGPPSLTFLEAAHAGFHSRGAAREEEVAKSGLKPHAFHVTFTLKKAEDYSKLVEIFTPFAQYVKANEPNTLTYELYNNIQDRTKYVIWERYVKETDLTETHRGSAEYKKLIDDLTGAGIVVAKEDRAYTEQQVGFWGQQ